MDYSIARQLTSKIPSRASTEEIKEGLQRIKKAQQQVLLQLKKNHPDDSIDVRTTNSQVYRIRDAENQNLKRQLNVEKEKSTQKSTLYRRRVVDLQSSLALHYQSQQKLKVENQKLTEQNKNLQQRYRDLQIDYEKLMEQSEKSNKNLRILEKQMVQLNKKMQTEDTKSLRLQFQSINAQRNSIMAQKVALLKNYSKLESQNIQLKMKITSNYNEKQKQQKNISYNSEEINKIVSEIGKINAAHEYIFNNLKSNTKLSKVLIEKQNSYQNSLNKILEMLGSMQKNQVIDGGYFRFDHEQSFKQQIKRVEADLVKKHRRQAIKLAAEKQEIVSKLKMKDKKIQQMNIQNKQLQIKLNQIRKQKTQFMDQITQLNAQISTLRQNNQKRDRQKIDQQILKQKSKDQQYRSIITELNEQMLTIQKQKKNLDGMISKMTNVRSEEDQKNKKKLNQIVDTNQQIRAENERVKEKYEAILIQKEHLYLSVTEIQNKNENLNRQIARQVLQKEKLLTQLNRIKQEKQLNLVELQRFKILSENTKKQSQNSSNSYMFQIQRLIQQGMLLRQEIQILTRDRNELRELKSKYELLMKDNQILGKKAKYTNSQIDHLWMIKQIQYQNLNKVINDLKPL